MDCVDRAASSFIDTHTVRTAMNLARKPRTLIMLFSTSHSTPLSIRMFMLHAMERSK